MNRRILFIVAAIALTGAVHAQPPSKSASRLVGTWVSISAENGALPGELTLNRDKSMSLRPQGQPEFKGTWLTKDTNTLVLAVPEAGESHMSYQLEKTTLTLTYNNGNKQAFRKGRPTPTKKPSNSSPSKSSLGVPAVQDTSATSALTRSLAPVELP